jgi:CubicO group peptidase (beta-lactamase class C family)
LIARGDKIVSEVYGEGLDASSALGTASLAKSLVAGMSLLLLLQDDRIHLDDPVCNWIPEWCTDRWKSRITIRHLATHASGLENPWIDGVPSSELPGWKGEFWRRGRSRWQIWRSEPNPFEIARDRAPLVFEPGQSYAYSNSGVAILGIVAAAALRNAPESDVEMALRERLMRPIGIPDTEWGISYGRTWKLDGLPLHANWGGAVFTARATARIGRLLLREGQWQGRTILDSRWVRLAASDQHDSRPASESDSFIPVTGLLWWLNTNRVWPSLPPDALVGAGDGHKVLLVIPSLDLIVVCNRKEPDARMPSGEERNEYWASLEDVLFRPLMAAVTRSDFESPPPALPQEQLDGLARSIR